MRMGINLIQLFILSFYFLFLSLSLSLSELEKQSFYGKNLATDHTKVL